SGNLTAHYTYGFGLVSQVSVTGLAAYYDFNNVGSTIGITGTNGNYLNKYAYLPFGETTTLAASVPNPFTYVGQLGVTQDGDGLIHMRMRDYAPTVGAFISNDPLGRAAGDANTRRYVRDNPGYVDPSGLCSITYGVQGGFVLGSGFTYTLNSDGSLYFTEGV